jgi:type IV pilus assembly protein PilA
MNMKNMKQARQQGFTLIELMIVIAIVGILSAVALPAYQNYTVRAKLSEVFAHAGAYKTGITEYYQSTGTTPPDGNAVAIPTNMNGVIGAGVAYATDMSFVITLTAGGIGNASGKAITFTPTSGSGQISAWTCTSNLAAVDKSLLPANCRG